jgi:hypothetical protein
MAWVPAFRCPPAPHAMPALRHLFEAVWRFGGRWVAAAVLWSPRAAAWADHGVPTAAQSGFGWMSWLLVTGAVAAVGLAAWAFFAPDRPEDDAGPGRREKPASEPPVR